MNDTTYLIAGAILASVILTWAVVRLWRRLPPDPSVPPVRVMGAYSPVLTWLRHGRAGHPPPQRLAAAAPLVVADEPALRSENERLRQRVLELEAQVAELGASASRPAWPVDAARLRALAPSLLWLALAVGLAAAPAALTVPHTWWGDVHWVNQLREGWCQVEFLCRTSWPAYFGLVMLATAAALVLVAWDRRPLTGLWAEAAAPASVPAERLAQRPWSNWLFGVAAVGLVLTFAPAIAAGRHPTAAYAVFLAVYFAGWVVREGRPEAVIAWWRPRQAAWVAAGLAHVALIGLLASYYGARSLVGLMVLLLTTALANLWRYRRQVHPLYWIISGALVAYTARIDGWWFAAVGDEYSFFRYAAEIVLGETDGTFSQKLFFGTGVYGTHPYLSSALQALSMRLLGLDNFGWRFSSLYLSALSIGLLYVFARPFVQRRVALLAAMLLGVSHYVMTFGKIGYNNLQALFSMGLVLAAAAWALRTRQRLAFAGLGLALGFGFYVYPAALYVLPLPLLLLWLFDRPRSPAAWRAWGVMGLTALLVVAPLLLQPRYWETKIAGTLFYNPDITYSAGTVVNHIATNLLYAFFSYWYTPEPTHFVTAAHVDPLSAVFVTLGLGCVLRAARRERFALFLLAGLGLLLLLVGATHDRQFPSTTRMFLLLPWWALLAAIGLVWLQRALVGLGARRVVWGGVLAVVLVAIAGLNLRLAYEVSYRQAVARSGLESQFLRLARHVQALEGEHPKTFVFITDPAWGIDGLHMLQTVYSTPSSQAQLRKITLERPALLDFDAQRLADPDMLVILKPWLPEEWRQALEAQLAALGKQACGVTRTGQAQAVFVLWHSPEQESLCP